MEFFRIKKDIPFMRHALVFNVISLVTFVAAVLFLAFRGLNFSMDFTGGTKMEVHYAQSVNTEDLRQALSTAGYNPQVQSVGDSRTMSIQLPLSGDGAQSSENIARDVMATLDKAGLPKGEVRQVDIVGALVGQELAEAGAMALLMVVIGIVLYLAMRFERRFAVAAIIANLHDIVIILGFFSYFQWEFSLPVLAAVLAVLGYSVNESVVVFDRVRETFRKRRDLTTPQVIDHAITATISRTVITHGSTQVMVLSMLLFGGAPLHYFAVALTIGICFGIYSSVLVASPLAMWFGVSREQFAKMKAKKQEAVV
ncbi:MAG: protein translocase subunit SecF [Azoarcus sp.]|jgi:preprotein translocase subunit SecF|nr:protein translocase subunit SecF [Azoarcus sp.]